MGGLVPELFLKFYANGLDGVQLRPWWVVEAGLWFESLDQIRLMVKQVVCVDAEHSSGQACDWSPVSLALLGEAPRSMSPRLPCIPDVLGRHRDAANAD
jgi:hypothetical protein